MKMLKIVLVDHEERDHLLPLTFTRPVAQIRVGIWTIAEKWEKRFNAEVSYKTQEYLDSIYPTDNGASDYAVNGAVIPTQAFVDQLLTLAEGENLYQDDRWLASKTSSFVAGAEMDGHRLGISTPVDVIDRNWKIFQLNGKALDEDFEWLKNQGESQAVPDGVHVTGDNLFIEEGAIIRPCIINAETGPVYLAKDSEVMEGALIRGGLALMEGSQIKMGAKIYGPTTIGPHSRVGGEVNNAVIFGYSNKGHDGYIGNTVIGEWCNLGADTNTSNLKNNYTDVKIHNYALGRSESTGGQFCGLTMGDHSKSGINTMFNTGTVCGVFANVFGSGFPHRKIPDFGWGGAEGFKRFRIDDALQVAEKVMSRRGVLLTDDLKKAYTHLFETLTVD